MSMNSSVRNKLSAQSYVGLVKV